MKTAILAAAIVGSASAFAPALPKTSVSSTAISASVWDKYPGGEDFRGAEFKFDPFKFSETYEPFQGFFRESELRHGRTAMLAVAGYVVADFARLPGQMYSFENVPSSAAAHDILVQSGPMHQLLLWISLWDIVITFPSIQAMNKGEREAGDYGFRWLTSGDAKEMEKRKRQELLNGRLAMMAFGGIVTQSVLTGHSFPYV